MGIFRKEAIASNKSNWIGRSSRSIPKAYGIPFFLSFIIIFILLCLIIKGTYSINVEASGVVAFNPNAYSLISPMDGMVEGVKVIDGQYVSVNEKIMFINNKIKGASGIVSKEKRENLNNIMKLFNEKIILLNKKRDVNLLKLSEAILNKKNELRNVEGFLSVNKVILSYSKDKYDSFISYKNKGVISEMMLYESRESVLLNDEKLKNTLVNLTRVKSDLINLEKEVNILSFSTDEMINNVKQSMIEISQQLIEVDISESLEIVSPISGNVVGINKIRGNKVRQGDIVASVIPKGAVPVIRLQIGAESVGEIKIGQKVKLRVAAYPWKRYGKFIATIISVSEAVVHQENGKYFVVTVSPENRIGLPLKQGMQVEASILSEKKELYKWLFRMTN
ncbi:HlyD family secretion protein [Providencia rettgeri]